ncbi:hypothetical protein, partial [Actinoplanes regularis]|uniref:hypothetical protein n=1 Tax=Actinoplanes regularis TaxID=52697 RepID=UPI0025578693
MILRRNSYGRAARVVRFLVLPNPLIGKYVEGFIARPITDADIRPQTNNTGVVQTYRDGRIKAV